MLFFGLMLALGTLAGCQARKPPAEVAPPVKSFTRLAPPPVSAAEIQALMQRARSGEDLDAILAEFDRLAIEGEPLLRDEARFRKLELMLEMKLPEATEQAEQLLAELPDHALAPYADFWLARYWTDLGESERALEAMGRALRHPRLTRELADQMLALGSSLAPEVPESDALHWLMAAAEVDEGGRESWLRLAARRASLPTLEAMHADGSLPPDLMASFDLHAARKYLMTGDMAALGRIADLLNTYLPASPEAAQVRAWASGEVRAASIGVMLPLTGDYARFGEAALRGLRMALAVTAGGEQIQLRIEDTAGDPAQAARAYRRLVEAHVDLIIGPLLARVVESLLPQLEDDMPMISLTGRTDLAAASPALFVHTLSPLAQVEFMARYAWQQGAQRMVVLATDDGNGMVREAEQFRTAFERLGGEVMQTLLLQPMIKDHRAELTRLRYETDDEELLAELDQDLALLLPEIDVDITMPVHFDAMYVAMPGRDVAMMAGQWVYTDIKDVPIYGSSRWADGHLLDDRGRYLSHARFAGTSSLAGQEDQARRQLMFTYREAWGTGEPDDLTTLAYDTMLIAAVMASRLGLHGKGMIRELHDAEGFPGLTGHVRFDANGVGQKLLDVFGIMNGRIVPAG